MNRSGRGLRRAAAAGFASAVAAAMLAGPAPAGAQAAAQGPVVKLIVAQNSITLSSFRGRVFLDPGVYVASLGSALQFDVQRASYTKPITLTQVIYRPGGGTTTRPLPSSLLGGFKRVAGFLAPGGGGSARQGGANARPGFLPYRGAAAGGPRYREHDPVPAGMRVRPVPEGPGYGPAEGLGGRPGRRFLVRRSSADCATRPGDLQGDRYHRPAVRAPAAHHRCRRDGQRQAQGGE